MKIGLIDIDCHTAKKKFGATVYPNLALCKISAWHKAHGDEVEWYIPFTRYDRVYVSKIFSFSEDHGEFINADEVVRGGTGYDLHSFLPYEVDHMRPDYSIYPHIPSDTAYGFLTRGCPNKCSWCVVPEKEGGIRPYMDCDEIADEQRRNLILMDNNILAAGDYCAEQLKKIAERGYRIDFNQAMDARLVNEDNARLLANCKWIRRIRFGCDTAAQIKACDNACDLLRDAGYKGEFFFYCMLHGTLRECLDRVNHWKIKGGSYLPYCQPYIDPHQPYRTPPQWQKDMAAWVNKKMIFKTCDFKDFEPRKGFKCIEYIINEQ